MTMAEIDRLRAVADDAIERSRTPEPWPPSRTRCRCHMHGRLVLEAESAVEAALREWWAQGCRDA